MRGLRGPPGAARRRRLARDVLRLPQAVSLGLRGEPLHDVAHACVRLFGASSPSARSRSRPSAPRLVASRMVRRSSSPGMASMILYDFPTD